MQKLKENQKIKLGTKKEHSVAKVEAPKICPKVEDSLIKSEAMKERGTINHQKRNTGA